MVDTGIKMKHLRKSGTHRVNTKAGRCELHKYGGIMQDLSRAGLD